MELKQIGFSIGDDGSFIESYKNVHTNKKSTKNKNVKIIQKYEKLYKIYSELYDLLNIDLFETREMIYINNLIAYPEDRQAEVNGTQFLDLDERIRRNKECLSNMIQETIENTTKETKTLLTSL